MALAGGVLHQQHRAGSDDAALAVAGGYPDAAVEVDDVLAAGRGMPVEVIVRRGLAEDDAGGGQARGVLAELALLRPLDLDVAKMRDALGIDVEIVNAHALSLPLEPRCRQGECNESGDWRKDRVRIPRRERLDALGHAFGPHAQGDSSRRTMAEPSTIACILPKATSR